MTVLELLKERLPNEYVVAVIGNLPDKNILDQECESLLDPLKKMFNWTKSREGYDFWNEVYWAIINGDKLPEIPFKAAWKPNSYLSTSDGDFIINLNGKGKDVHLLLDFTEHTEDEDSEILKEIHFAFCN